MAKTEHKTDIKYISMEKSTCDRLVYTSYANFTRRTEPRDTCLLTPSQSLAQFCSY